MKKLIIPAFSLLLLSLAVVANGQEEKKTEKTRYEFFREKNISKTYPASGNHLFIENSFGNVKVIPWDRNEIKVDVHIEASANKDDMAQRIFDAITVTDKQKGNEIYFKTDINNKNGKSDNCKNCKSTMKIDYELRLPVSVALNIENSFGGIEVPDYSGPISLISKFGSLKSGSINNAKKLLVEFGSANIQSVGNIEAEFKFSKVEIDKLSGKSKINLEFCSATKIGLDNNLSALDLNESYSSVNIRPGNLGASYTVSTSFGNFVDRTSAGVKRIDTPEKYGPDSNRRYEGKSGNGAAKVDIKSSFGNIILGEPTAEDLKKHQDKTKNKNKNKSQSKAGAVI